MAENRRDKEKRFYFSRGQLVFLGFVFTLAAVIIFFLGIFAGKGIEERRLVRTEEPLAKIPVKPPALGAAGTQGGTAKDELTFYNTLAKSKPAQPAAEEKAKETKTPVKEAKAEVKESKAQTKDAKPQTKEAPQPPKPIEKKAEKSPPAAPEPKPDQSTQTAESKESGKGWTVQVNAFPDERSAKTWVDRLKNKGYNAFVTEVNIKGKNWYRVRVGQYSNREEAKKVEEVLKTKENYTKAFTASR